jgi:HEPN domain-containing protein
MQRLLSKPTRKSLKEGSLGCTLHGGGWCMGSYEEHLGIARYYLEEAYRLLERGDPFDAAEKVWAAVRHATIALTLKVLGEATPPKGLSWRSFVREAFIKAGLSESEASSLASYYIDVRSRLHGGCFYGLTYEEEEHRPLMEKARDYVELVERIVRGTVKPHPPR